MLLGVRPIVFLARLLFFFALVYVLWEPFAPAYTKLLGVLTQVVVSATELFGSSATRGATTVIARGNGIFFLHRLFPQLEAPGIPGDWVQANMVLLLPLMLATPAPTLKARAGRLALAIAVAMGLQVLGLVVTIKTTWASDLGRFSVIHYGWLQRKVYQFTDAFFQSFDTQLFPVAIWAGIHLRQLMATVRPAQPAAARAGGDAPRHGKKRRPRRGGGA